MGHIKIITLMELIVYWGETKKYDKNIHFIVFWKIRVMKKGQSIEMCSAGEGVKCTILNRILRVGFIQKVTAEQRREGSKEVAHLGQLFLVLGCNSNTCRASEDTNCWPHLESLI